METNLFRLELVIPEIKVHLAHFFEEREIEFKKMVDQALMEVFSEKYIKAKIKFHVESLVDRKVKDEIDLQLRVSKKAEFIKSWVANKIRSYMREYNGLLRH